MQNDEKYRFCPVCGALMTEAEGCVNCGYPRRQNQYYQEPFGNMYGQSPNSQQNGRKNNTAVIAVVIIAAVTVLLCVAMVLVYLVVKNVMATADFSFTTVEKSDNIGEDFWGSLQEEEIMERIPDSSYSPASEDEYYETIVNAVRDDLSYSVEWEEFDFKDEETGAAARGKYPRLVGDGVPNLEVLNEEIAYNALYYSDLYNHYREEGTLIFSYTTESIAYVTYMDEEKISIVLDEYFEMNGDSYVSLYCINIDLRTGTVLDNEDILFYSMELAEIFRKQSDYQNGEISAVSGMSDEEIMDYLSDSDCNIVFYTPVGMEIGYNYSGVGGNSGWVTATLKDYRKYIKKI